MEQRVELMEESDYLALMSSNGFLFDHKELNDSLEIAKKISHLVFSHLFRGNERVDDVCIFEHADRRFVSILILKVEEDRNSS